MNFKYAPGLPGYGTRGIDGSGGISGLGMYFTDYNGLTNTLELSNKIANNQSLMVGDNTEIPGYPERKYQSGDMFLDSNAVVFEIDLELSNLYDANGSALNTSGDLESGPLMEDIGFQRKHNKVTSDRIVIDSVYSTNPAQYSNKPQDPATSTISSIYDTTGLYYGGISYVDSAMATSLDTGYHPYQLWSSDSDVNHNIALVKANGEALWRFGNYNGITVRDTSLALDFGHTLLNGDITIAKNSIKLTTGGEFIVGDNENAIGHGILFSSGDSVSNNTTLGYDGGEIWNETGKGGDVTSGATVTHGGSGGEFKVVTGHGGDIVSSATNSIGGYGGRVYFDLGNAGVSDTHPGVGGDFVVRTGWGGSSEFSQHLGIGYGEDGLGVGEGDAGQIFLYGNTGGDSNERPGKGGGINIISGDGGKGLSVTERKNGGDGGHIIIQSGDGTGTNTELYGTGDAGHGGDILIKSGNGEGAPSTDREGRAGNITINAGLATITSGSGTEYGNIFLGTSGSGVNKGRVLIGDGEEYAPGLAFATDLTKGIGTFGDDQIAFITGSIGTDMIGMVLHDDGSEVNLKFAERPVIIRSQHTSEFRPDISLECGTNNGYGTGNTVDGGFMRLKAGDATGHGAGGHVFINAGDSTADNYGNVIITGGTAGSSSDTNANTGGYISLKSGRNGPGDAGDILFDVEHASYSSGADGEIKMIGLGILTSGVYLGLNSNVVGKYGSISDERLKDINEKKFTNTLDKLDEINPVYFEWSDFCLDTVTGEDNTKEKVLNIGLIAQDVDKHFPELTSLEKGKDGIDYLGIDYPKMVPVLLASIKELHEIVKKQQDQIDQLLKN